MSSNGPRGLGQSAIAICGALLLAWASVGHAQGSDIVRGTVRSDSGRVIAGAAVMVTRSSDRALSQTSTDSAGRWRVAISDGSGDYLVFISAVGFQSARRRVQRVANERELVVDMTLATSAPQVLRAVQVQAGPPPRPGRGAAPRGTEEVGASEKWVDGVAGARSPNARGDLSAMIGMVPGLTTGPGGASLLGADASSNLNTLNGAALPGGRLPRAANVDARFSGATFDPTRGGFAGGQFELQLAAGSRDLQSRRAFLTLDPSVLQRTDAIGRAQGLNGQNVRASLGADGELLRRRVTYNGAFDVQYASSSPATLLSADASTLRQAGLLADSVRQFTTIANTLRLPVGDVASTGVRNTSFTWLGRVDDIRDTSRVLSLHTYLSRAHDDGVGAQPLVAPSAVSRGTLTSGMVQVQHQHYVGRARAIYNENRLAFSRTARDAGPALSLPGAAVVVGATDAEGALEVATLQAGGATSPQVDEQQWTTEGATEWAWLAKGTRHRFRAIGWFRGDGIESASRANAFGIFQFSSLAELAANRPASYTRTLIEPRRAGQSWNSAVALAHRWAPNRRFQALYGARVEAGALVGAPDANADVASALGVRTDRVARQIAVSPRAGFTWRPLKDRPVSTGINESNLGLFIRPSTNIVRGGIGLFRDLYRPSTIATAAAQTGLAGSTLTLACTGSAAPTPSWTMYTQDVGTIPSVCAGSDAVLAQRAPSVLAIDPSYDVPRSWRASVNWSGAAKGWLLRAEAMAARNLGLAGRIDHNVNPQARFVDGGDGRPIFVLPAGIDPASGVTSAVGSRRDGRFGAVRTLRNDLQSEGAQLTLGVTSDIFRGGGRFVSGSYTVQTVRQQYRGYDGASSGDPSRIEWARGAGDARHSILLQGGLPIPRVGTFSVFMRLQSGLPFTPLVAGDIDGDGVGGDRAAIVDPSRDADATRRAGMTTLLASASPRIRDCLAQQFGTVATRQSCRGSWTYESNARLDVRIPSRLLGRRTSLAINLANPLGGLDQLLHGNRLRGWGGPGVPDPVLLVPRGFDPTAQRFLYRVNPRFGDTRPASTLLRSPFRVSMDFSWDLSRDAAAQQLDRSLDPERVNGSWQRPSAAQILRRYEARVSSVHTVILFNADTLFLTRSQIESFTRADSVFRSEARAIYAVLSDSLAALPLKFDGKAAVAMVARANSAYEALFWKQRDVIKAELSTVQGGALPNFIKNILTTVLDPDRARWPRYRFDGQGSSVSVSIG
ncbi:MAG: TonB-dependent receptor [Gemmatimonadaceae bacterium]|nr:TonB-dependent receptor [Gemmatimonadaceae bacterium]